MLPPTGKQETTQISGGRSMTTRIDEMISFESERSIGPTGDALYLDIRHRILTGQYAPLQAIDPHRLAEHAAIPKSVAADILRALADHGYLIAQEDHRYQVVHWTTEQFRDLLDACEDLIGVAIAKCMTRINSSGLARLQEAVAFEFQDTIDEIQVETMQIRWWVFWQTIISAIEVRNFRRMMLTGMPPALRRRVITSLDPKGLRSMLADMTLLVAAFQSRDHATGAQLLKHQFAAFAPDTIAANKQFNSLTCSDEINLHDRRLLSHPVFRPADDVRPPFSIGFREPLSWAEFEAMGLAQ